MGGRVPFRGGHVPGGRGAKSRGAANSVAKGNRASGSGSKGRRDDGCGSDSRGSIPHLVSRITPSVYRLHDTLEPESPEDSVGTTFPIDVPLLQRSGSSSRVANASPSTTLLADAIAAENIATRAAATATAAAETAAATAATAIAAAAAAAHAAEDENIDGLYFTEENKITLRVVRGKKLRFEPSAATRSGKILRSRVCKEGSKWGSVTQVMKDFYWEEFKKYYKWPSALEVLVKECRNTSVAKQYGDFINDRKNDKKKQEYIPANVWCKWIADWNTPEALELSQSKQNARKGGVNGQCSKHTGGSITASEHAKCFEKKNKRKPMYNELFDLMHRRKGGEDFVDDKSASIDAAFKARKLELSQQSDGSPMPSDNEIYLEVVGGQNKDGDVYGIGSQGSSIVNQSSCSSPSEQAEVVSLSVVQEIVQQFIIDYELQNEERIGQRIGKEVESRIIPLQSMLLTAQDLIARLSTISEATHPTQVSEENPANSSQENHDENFMRDDLDDHRTE